MIYSKFLNKWDNIGVCAPSDGKVDDLDLVRFNNGVRKLGKLGYGVVFGENVFCSDVGRSASGRKRARYLEEMFSSLDVSVLISCGGGDFLVEMLSYVDFSVIKMNPKWFCGYSDNTGIGFLMVTMLDIASIYGDNFGCFGAEEWHKSIYNFLSVLEGDMVVQNSFLKYQGNYLEYKSGVESYVLDSDVCWKNLFGDKDVKFSGRFVGGCLDVLLNLVGTRFDCVDSFLEKYKDEGIVWFLESFDLSSEELIRGLWQLKEASWFKYVKGFVFGRPVMVKSYYDISYEDSISSVLGELGVPVVIDADFGHTAPRMTFINGSFVEISSKGGKGSVKMILK